MDTDDQELVTAVLARTPGAFERLVCRHEKLVWHLVQRMVERPDEARELCQEVFLRVFRQLHQFRHESALGTWIGRIAFRVASRHLRRRRLPMLESDSAGHDVGERLEEVSDPVDLQHRVELDDLLSHMAKALATLPPLLRTLITLYHLDELSISEIAAVTELPEGTIKSHLFRARQRLRSLLESSRSMP